MPPRASSLPRVARCLVAAIVAALPVAPELRAQPPREPPPGQGFPLERFLADPFGPLSLDDEAELADVAVSPAEERRLGDAQAAAYVADLRRRKIKVVERSREVAYLRELVDALRPHMAHGARYEAITIYLAEAPDTDARSFPGGTLVVYRGLLDFVDSEAALVGVLGHELSHLDRGHQLAPLRRAKRLEQSLRGGAAPQAMLSSMRSWVGGFARPFRPEDESQADRDGAEWAFRAGYDPGELASVLRKLHARDGQGAAPIAFLRTHPFPLDRARALDEHAQSLRREFPGQTTYVGRRNLAERTPRSRREYPE